MQHEHDIRIRQLQNSIKYCFSDVGVLNEALTHKSYYHENKSSALGFNERLEFLGDAVLGLIVVEMLYLRKESFSESVLAKMKSYLVSELVLAEIALSIDLGAYLYLGKGERMSGGINKKSILSDAFEALVGGIYIDGGYHEAHRVVTSFFDKLIAEVIDSGQIEDYKTELQEKAQALFGILPEYTLLESRGKEHEKIFTVAVYVDNKKLACAEGFKIKEAEMLAAKKALEKLSR